MYILAGFFLASNSDGHWSRWNKLAAIRDSKNSKTSAHTQKLQILMSRPSKLSRGTFPFKLGNRSAEVG
jgi:hypothetical protein